MSEPMVENESFPSDVLNQLGCSHFEKGVWIDLCSFLQAD